MPPPKRRYLPPQRRERVPWVTISLRTLVAGIVAIVLIAQSLGDDPDTLCLDAASCELDLYDLFD